ncbi:hypothetical protein SV7mr_40240 [Stieleria bergensis]|uniref:Type VI secretion protein, VC_A0111 family n=1 Tax=Stieleria bergensis TaxID=2528025 RepID=A0A517SZB1_9BACT|nr:hypothetical protein SV7mr_40240 [Planctomycetes bacterium SV_7m_r]
MADQDGTAPRAVADTLQGMYDHPYRFHFYHAMRLLERMFPDSPRLGDSVRIDDDIVRLSHKPSLKFAPAAVSTFKPPQSRVEELLDESELGHFQDQQPQSAGEMGVEFFGLTGPNGPLPLHLTEYAQDRIRHHDDPTFAAFLDIFHHRLLSLFYRAWANANPVTHRDRPGEDRYSVFVGSMMGLGQDSLRDRDALPDFAKLFYSGNFSCQSKSPERLQSMLSEYFGVPCQIEEFVGQWVALPSECYFRLGDDPASATLGEACTLGSHVWNCQQKFRVTVGPVNWQDFQRMLPGGASLDRLTAMVRNYIGDEWNWDLNIVLQREDVPSWQLGEGQLGQTVWSDAAGVKQDSRDLLIAGNR